MPGLLYDNKEDWFPHLQRNICCFAFKLDFGSSLSSSPSLKKIITMMMMTMMSMITLMMRWRTIPCQVKVEGGVILLVHNVVDAATHFYHYLDFHNLLMLLTMKMTILMLMLMLMMMVVVMLLMMIMIVVVMLLMKRPVSVDEKIFHAVSEVLRSILRDIEDPTGLMTIIIIMINFAT